LRKQRSGALQAGGYLRAAVGSYCLEELAGRLPVFGSGFFEAITEDFRAIAEGHQAELIMFIENTEAGLDGLLGLVKGSS
jgi:hypothetical protein